MAIATSLAIAGIASAAGSAIKAHQASKGAKQAAKEQEKAIGQAQDFNRQSMGQIGQLYAPYINQAQSAANWSARLTTPGAGAKFASPGPPNATPLFMGGGQSGQAIPRGAAPPIQQPPMGGPGGPPPGPGGPSPGRRPPPGMQPPAGAPGGQQTMVQTRDGQVRPMPMAMAQQMFQSGMGRPVQGPYEMAEGGDFNVDQPTMFLAGEAGPERATFSGARGGQQPWMPMGMGGGGQSQGWGGFGSMLSQMRSPNMPPGQGQKPLPRGLATRPGSLQGAMMGGMGAAGANAMRSMGPMAGMFGGGGPPPRPGGMGGGLRIGAGGMGMYGEPLPPPQSGGMFGGGQFIDKGEGPPGYAAPGFAGGFYDPSGGGAPMGGGSQDLSAAMGAMRGGPGPYGGPSGGFRSPRDFGGGYGIGLQNWAPAGGDNGDFGG